MLIAARSPIRRSARHVRSRTVYPGRGSGALPDEQRVWLQQL